MTSTIVLKTDSIEKSFSGIKALNGISVELIKGEIHAIVGENGAGKSTLMNIISGVIKPDSGKIFIEDREVFFESSKKAQECGIGFVHQELALCPDLSVADNIFIGRLPTVAGMVDRKKLHNDTLELLGPFEASIQPDQLVSDLSVAQQQIVEIAKAVSLDSKVIIFDEPTSSLNEREAEILIDLIKNIAKNGIGVFYISHKLSEIFQVCNRITIMRDGNYITTHKTNKITADEVVSEMVGKKIDNYYPAKSMEIKDEELFRVENFSHLPIFKNISFSLKKGEILGLGGLVGSGRTEVARAICSVDPYESGKIFVEGEEIIVHNYKDALKQGLCYLSEDRKLDGLFLEMDINENIIAPQLDNIANCFMLSNGPIARITSKYKERLNIKYSSSNQKVKSLSGGNQQKIMIAKLLALNPKVIIMDEPTRGIDVGAKSEIHNMLRELCKQGVGVIVISSEIPELVGISDKVVIMSAGKVVGQLSGEEITQDNLIAKISKNKAKGEEKIYESV